MSCRIAILPDASPTRSPPAKWSNAQRPWSRTVENALDAGARHAGRADGGKTLIRWYDGSGMGR
jgi:hypothetical protein